jgi:recombination protein RecA
MSRVLAASQLLEKPVFETLPTGIAAVDAALGGLPRGALTEICGAPSSGRTSLLLAVLAQATTRLEACALVDVTDAFDPASAAAAGVDLDRLLWVRCRGNVPHALTAADWLTSAGGFGVVALDLADLAPAEARRIPLSSWYRLRRAVENTPTVLAALEAEPWAKSCSSLILQLHRERVTWLGPLLGGAVVRVERRKPKPATVSYPLSALGDRPSALE